MWTIRFLSSIGRDRLFWLFCRRAENVENFMCNCNVSVLNQREISHKRNLTFDDYNCNVQHDVFANFCKSCLYNLNNFMRNYVSCTNCACLWTATDIVCLDWLRLRNALSCNVSKICIREVDALAEFRLLKINEYFERKFRASPFIYYCKQQN